MSITINGTKVTLRDWIMEDVPVWEGWLDPRNDWYRTDGPFYGLPSLEDIRERVEALRIRITDRRFDTPRRNLVIAERESNLLIGQVSWYWQDRATSWLSAGISIYDPAWRGSGIGFEALGLWTDYLFASFPDIVRVDLRTWSGNDAMIGLARKLGYVEEARFRDARIVDGVHYDALGYGVLRSEWSGRHPGGFTTAS